MDCSWALTVAANSGWQCLTLTLPQVTLRRVRCARNSCCKQGRCAAHQLTTCQKGMMIVQAGLWGVSLYLSTNGTTGMPATKAPVLNLSTHRPWLSVPSGATDSMGIAGLEALCTAWHRGERHTHRRGRDCCGAAPQVTYRPVPPCRCYIFDHWSATHIATVPAPSWLHCHRTSAEHACMHACVCWCAHLSLMS